MEGGQPLAWWGQPLAEKGQPLVWGTCGLPWTHQVTQKFIFSQLRRWCTRRSTWLQGSTCHSSQGSRLQLVVSGGGRPARKRQWNGLRLRWSRLSTHWISRIWKPPLQFLEHCMESERKEDTWVLGIRLSMPRYPGVSQRITKFPASSSQLLERLVACLSLHTMERRVTLAAPQDGAPRVRNAGVEVWAPGGKSSCHRLTVSPRMSCRNALSLSCRVCKPGQQLFYGAVPKITRGWAWVTPAQLFLRMSVFIGGKCNHPQGELSAKIHPITPQNPTKNLLPPWLWTQDWLRLFKESKVNNCSVVSSREWANPVLGPTARLPCTSQSPIIFPPKAIIACLHHRGCSQCMPSASP